MFIRCRSLTVCLLLYALCRSSFWFVVVVQFCVSITGSCVSVPFMNDLGPHRRVINIIVKIVECMLASQNKGKRLCYKLHDNSSIYLSLCLSFIFLVQEAAQVQTCIQKWTRNRKQETTGKKTTADY